MKSNGFILVELLVALTICAITMGLFVHSSKNRAQMLILLEENYSSERLKNDFLILAKIKKIDDNLILKLAPKIVEGVDKLKKWSTST